MKQKLNRIFVAALAFVALGACSERAAENAADTVITNGKIYTVDDSQPWVEAVAIAGGEIVYVGSAVEVEGFVGESTTVLDAGGKLVLPGFIDSHSHILDTSALENPYVMNIDQSREEWLAGLAEYAEANPDLPFIFGFGWMGSIFGEDGPNRQMLDAVVSDRPVVLRDEGFHAVWANTAALEALNITRDTSDPVPGYSYYKRDENGDATGYILETAAQHAVVGIGLYADDRLASGLAAIIDEMNAMGITTTFDAGVTIREGLFATKEGFKTLLDEVEANGDFTMRIVGSYRPEGKEVVAGAADETLAWRDHIVGDRFRFDTVKVPYDGTVEARNAAMFDDYKSEPGNSGETLFTIEELTTMVTGAAGAGVDVHAHGLGDRAVSDILDAIEVARELHPDSETRYTICHVQVIADKDIDRFAELDVIAQSSPVWAAYDVYGEDIVTEDQFNRYWRFKDLLDVGAKLTLGSDGPATGYGIWGMRPVVQIEVGHTRQDFGSPDRPIQPPESQRLSIEQLVRGYTIDSAYQLHMEDEIGSIEVGKKADIVILDQNIFDVDPYTIHQTEVVMTMLDGEVIYEMPDS